MYIIDHCTKITNICMFDLSAGMLDKISPTPRIQGTAYVFDEISFEQLQAKLPNLIRVDFSSGLSHEYIAEFCGAFPLLISVGLPDSEELCSDDVINGISSLQHLREITTRENLTWLEE